MCPRFQSIFQPFLSSCVTLQMVTSRKWLNANVSCYLTLAKGLSNMLFYLKANPIGHIDILEFIYLFPNSKHVSNGDVS